MAGEELLHGGLFEVALLCDELLQRTDQRIHITQRHRDNALFGQRRQGNSQRLDNFETESGHCTTKHGCLEVVKCLFAVKIYIQKVVGQIRKYWFNLKKVVCQRSFQSSTDKPCRGSVPNDHYVLFID